MAPRKATKKPRAAEPATANKRFDALIAQVKKKRTERTSKRLFKLSQEVVRSKPLLDHANSSPDP
jgi:hypothetical protein